MRPPNPMQSAPDIEEDRRIVLHGVTWEGFEHWLKMRGDDPGVRIAYLDGELELMSPGRQHERHKSDIERLLFTWADETGTDITGTGSETLMEARFARGAEADSSFIVGPEKDGPPDIVVEVIRTRPLVDKLDIYWKLGVREVWCWRPEQRFTVFARGRKGWVARRGSRLLPDLDLALVAKHIGWKNPSEAARQYRQALRQSLKRRRS